VKAEVTRRNLTLTPKLDGSATDSSATTNADENAFAVTVTNESQSFASFQLELSTPGVTADAVNEWYRVEPQICTKKPPGASTTFEVVILRSPIPVYETTIDLLLRVFSIEHRNLFTTQKLSLTIYKPKQTLVLSLPTEDFKAAPSDRVEIPVLLSNYSASTLEAKLVLIGLDPWVENAEQILRVDPTQPTKARFVCQIPADPTLLSQRYPFTVQATPAVRGPIPPAVRGSLEILPLGMVEFRCQPTHQQIPPAKPHAVRFSAQSPAQSPAQTVAYQVQLQNASHLPQQVNITASEVDRQTFGLTLPQPVILAPGAIESLSVTVDKPRHWLGGKRHFEFDLTAEVYEPDARNYSHRTRAVPERQRLGLTVLSRIPNWLLGLLALLLLAGLLWRWLLLPQHRAAVNSVRLDGNASTVFSGSSDQSILRWQVDNHLFRRLAHRLKYEEPIASSLGRAVRVIRLKPADNNIVAAGLENGTIQLWDVLGNQPEQTLFSDNDRVFDLTFSPDSRYLFSGHGSGQVRQWDLAQPSPQSSAQPSDQPRLRLIPNPISFSIAALTTYQPEPDVSWIGIAGQFNQLLFWDWTNRRVYQVQPVPPMTLSGGQYQYIESLAISSQTLVTADNQGYITIWDLAKRQCSAIQDLDLKFIEVQGASRRRVEGGNCRVPILDRWNSGHGKKPVRSVAITQNGVYLASVGDDSRVKLWQLQQGQRATGWQNGRTLAQLNANLYGVDIQAAEQNLIITVAAANRQVYAYRVPIAQDGF
jgi:WD40 repeat protein